MRSLALGRGSPVTKQEVPLADTHLLGIITLGGLPGPRPSRYDCVGETQESPMSAR